VAQRDGFGKRFGEFRRRAQLTQRQLAQKLDLDYTYISKIEGGAVPLPSRERIQAAAAVFRLSQTERTTCYCLPRSYPPTLNSGSLESRTPWSFTAA